MATYSRREIHTTRVEFPVPAGKPYGACWVEIYKAVSAAIQEMRYAGELAADEEPSDEAIRIRPDDDEVIVSYEITRAFAERGGS